MSPLAKGKTTQQPEHAHFLWKLFIDGKEECRIAYHLRRPCTIHDLNQSEDDDMREFGQEFQDDFQALEFHLSEIYREAGKNLWST
ncbi:MAG: DUF1987 domain-containing protein [bacterium]|nr:DUF1987 domain-containing protein [bacterium]